MISYTMTKEEAACYYPTIKKNPGPYIDRNMLLRDGWREEPYGFSRGTIPDLDACARGCYQRALLKGWERWSGAGLQGKAQRYSGRYAASRDGLIGRILTMYPGIEAQSCMVKCADGRHRRMLLVCERGPRMDLDHRSHA